METTSNFPSLSGAPGFFAIQGRVYHRVWPMHQNSAVRWLLYDGFLRDTTLHVNWISSLPDVWIEAVKWALLRANPFVQSLTQLAQTSGTWYPEAHIMLRDNQSTSEVRGVLLLSNFLYDYGKNVLADCGIVVI